MREGSGGGCCKVSLPGMCSLSDANERGRRLLQSESSRNVLP